MDRGSNLSILAIRTECIRKNESSSLAHLNRSLDVWEKLKLEKN